MDLRAADETTLRALVAEPQQAFEFTESDATIHFQRESSEVTLGASYARPVATVPLVELSLQVERFLARLVESSSEAS